jgi:protoheme IX farnesyltransferase
MSNLIYLVSAIVLGAGFLYWSFVLLKGGSRKAPMATFRYSITYLMLLFVALLVDHYAMPVTHVGIG